MPNTPGAIPITNVINISVSFASAGLPAYNVANLALFTTDAFLSNASGDLYRVYTSLSTVGSDFGTSSETYLQAQNVFAQQPNILNGGGFLIIVPIQAGAINAITVPGGSTGSGFKIGDVVNVIQGSASAGQLTVSATTAGAISAATILNPGFSYSVANSLTLSAASGSGISATINITSVATETLFQAISRANTYLYYNGIISTSYPSSTLFASLAANVQALGNQMIFLPSNASTDVSGAFNTIQLASDYFVRCLYYGGTAQQARLYGAAYASRLLSTNYAGSNTAITMNLKQLINVTPDISLTSTLLSQLSNAGVDCYGNYGGTYPGVVSVGQNKFADEAINLIWLVTQLQVAGFNCLATVGTKVPLTEPGMQTLKAAYRQVLAQAVSNGYLSPGVWFNANTFGNQALFLSNILQYGFYIYSGPVSQLSQTQINARMAPLVQIACLEAGAIQQSSVIVNILQ